jgi:hypothetical protein
MPVSQQPHSHVAQQQGSHEVGQTPPQQAPGAAPAAGALVGANIDSNIRIKKYMVILPV